MDRPPENAPVPPPDDSDVPPPEDSVAAGDGGEHTDLGSEGDAARTPALPSASYLEDDTVEYDNDMAEYDRDMAQYGGDTERPKSAESSSTDTTGSAAAAEEPGSAAAADGNRKEADEDWEDDEDKPLGGILPADFWNHVEDLRWVLIKSALAFFGAMLVMMVFSVRAQKLLIWPLEYGLRLSGSQNTDILLRTDGPFSVFTFMLQLWVFGGLLLSLPFILYFSAGFIAPGLTAREKKLLRPVAFSALGLFLLGCLFAFFLLLPTYIAVSLSLEKVFGFASLWTPSNYYGAVVWTTLGMGIVFQFPLVLILLQYLGLVTAGTLRGYRRHAFVFILIFAALLTPGGDPISLAICTIPLYALFELSMVVGERINKRTVAAEEDED